MSVAHRHHDLELNFVLAGSLTYLIGGALITLPERRLCSLWGAVPHQTTPSSQQAEAIWVTVPLSWVMSWELPGPLVQRLLRHGIAIEDEERSGDELLLRQWIRDLDQPDESSHRIVVLEIEARLRRLAKGLYLARRPARGGSPVSGIPQTVERLAQHIVHHYQEPVSMEQVARAAHVHPNYAMTLFRRHTGMTLHQYLTLQRVAHAQRLLMTSRQPILDIALACGFNSISRFYEAFKAETGLSPRQVRLGRSVQEGKPARKRPRLSAS